MQIHVTHDPTTPPYKQQSLKAIPSSDLVDHPAIKAAIEQFEKTLADEHKARLTAVQAEQDLGEADHLDALALADAIAAGKKDPGDKNRQQQLAAIQETRRHHQASVILLQRAIERVNDAFAEDGESYEADLHDERQALREQMARCLDEFSELHSRLQRNNANLRIGHRDGRVLAPTAFFSTVSFPARDFTPVEDVIAKLRELGKPKLPTQAGPKHRRAPGQSVPDIEAEIARNPDVSIVTAQRRAERQARAADKAAERQARREGEDEALEAVR